MKSINLMSDILSYVNSNKRVSKLPGTFEEDLKYYLSIIDRLNAAPRHSVNIDGVPYEKVPIIFALKGLVTPDSVTLSGKDIEFDFLKRPSLEGSDAVSYDHDRMKNFVSTFYGVFKKETPDLTAEQCKTNALLSSDPDSYSVDGLCVTDDVKSILIPISLRIYRDSRYLFDENEVNKEVIEREIRKINS